MKKPECPECGSVMKYVGESQDIKRNNHSRRVYYCSQCGYGPIEYG